MASYCFDSARDFIFRNARLLERRLYVSLFEDGSVEAVRSVLRAYQNPDGGFGNALEADLRTPVSQPLAVERAWVALDFVDALDGDLALRACDWLETVTAPDGGVPFAVPGLEAYPHTPWMDASNAAGQLNPTASLAGLLHKHKVTHPWLARASEFCWRAIPGFSSEQFHDLMPVIEFLVHTPENREMADAELNRIRQIVARPGVVAMDPEAQGYVQFPLDWAPRPDSFLRPVFSDVVIAQHLDALAARQQPDGGWPITWQALGPGAEAEWRGAGTINALVTLRAYGRTP